MGSSSTQLQRTSSLFIPLKQLLPSSYYLCSLKRLWKFKIMIGLIRQFKRAKGGLFGSAFIYTIATIINSAIPFLLMPVLTRLLTPEDYGYTAMFGVLSSIGAALIGLSVHGSISRFFFEREEIIFSEYVGTCVILLVGSSILIAFLSFPFLGIIAKLSSFPREWLFAVILTSFFQFIILLRLTIWQLEKKAIQFGLLQIVITITTLLLTILLIVKFHFNWRGRIVGQVFIQAIAALCCLCSLRRDDFLKFSYNHGYMKKALGFGLPLIPHAIGGLVIVMTDRFLLTSMSGLTQTGLYSVGVQLGMVVNILTDSFNKAYAPWLFTKLKENKTEDKLMIVKGTYLYFVLILLFVTFFSVAAPWIFSFFLGPKFNAAKDYIFWLALGGAFNGMYYMVTNYIFYAQKTKYLAWATFFSGILNVGISYMLIKYNGALGAAQGTAISLFISFVLTWILSTKVFAMPWFNFRDLFLRNQGE